MCSGVSNFGDLRMDAAGSFIHDRLVKIGPRCISVRILSGHRAGEVWIGRLLRNERVTVEGVVS